LVLKSNFSYKGFYTGDPVSYQLSIEGGSAPYAVAVDWGDGQTSLVSRSSAGDFEITHTYASASDYHGSYPIKLSATDARGQQTNLQIMTIINVRPSGIASQSTLLSGGEKTTLQQVLRYIWPTYGITVLMVTSFWLGERNVMGHLRRRRTIHHA
jgi:hypothetical protein